MIAKRIALAMTAIALGIGIAVVSEGSLIRKIPPLETNPDHSIKSLGIEDFTALTTCCMRLHDLGIESVYQCRDGTLKLLEKPGVVVDLDEKPRKEALDQREHCNSLQTINEKDSCVRENVMKHFPLSYRFILKGGCNQS